MVKVAERERVRIPDLREALLARAYLYDDAAAYRAGVDAALAALTAATSEPTSPLGKPTLRRPAAS